MSNENDSSDDECYETPKKIIVTANVHYPTSVTDRVLTSITKRPGSIIKSFRTRNSSRLTDICEDMGDMTRYSTFKSGYKLASSIIEDSRTICTQDLVYDDDILVENSQSEEDIKEKKDLTPKRKSIESKYQNVGVVPENLWIANSKKNEILKILQRNRKPKRGKKRTAAVKKVYGTALLDFLEEFARSKTIKKPKPVQSREEKDLSDIYRMLSRCEKLSSFIQKQISLFSSKDIVRNKNG